MTNQINIYCDESCHLENDRINVMTLGGVWCVKDKISEINREIRGIKAKYGINRFAEIKWAKVSPSKKRMYLEMTDYFFDNPDLHFRVLVIPDKNKLDHSAFDQTHDDFYYKMYYYLLREIWSKDYSYNIYLDIKDTHGGDKEKKLQDVLCSYHYDYAHNTIRRVQQVRSHEVELLQIADFLMGAVTYANRGLESSSTKLEIINKIREKSGFTLLKSTYPSEKKFNVFRWESSYGV